MLVLAWPVLTLLGLPTPVPTSGGVYPQQHSGFAASIVGGFLGLGLLVLAMVLLSLKPRRVDPNIPND